MNHSFDKMDALQYGIPAAILIEHFRFWIEKNRANEKHFMEGRTWSYNSVKAFTELFPYMGIKQIRAALDKLVTEGVLLKRDWNEGKADRTLWYAFRDEAAYVGEPGICLKRAHGMPKKGKAYAENGQASNKAVIDAVIDTYTSAAAPVFEPISYLQSQGVEATVIADYLAIRKKARKPATETALTGISEEAAKAGVSMNDALKKCCQRGWVGFEAAWLERRSTSRDLAPSNPGPGQSGMSAKTAATIANLNAYFGEQQ